MIIKTQFSPVKVKLPKEDPQAKKERLKKQAEQRRVLKALGVDTRFQLDVREDTAFLTQQEQDAYQRDCLLATLYLKRDTEIPSDLKERLLAVKAKREALPAARG